MFASKMVTSRKKWLFYHYWLMQRENGCI